MFRPATDHSQPKITLANVCCLLFCPSKAKIHSADCTDESNRFHHATIRDGHGKMDLTKSIKPDNKKKDPDFVDAEAAAVLIQKVARGKLERKKFLSKKQGLKSTLKHPPFHCHHPFVPTKVPYFFENHLYCSKECWRSLLVKEGIRAHEPGLEDRDREDAIKHVSLRLMR